MELIMFKGKPPLSPKTLYPVDKKHLETLIPIAKGLTLLEIAKRSELVKQFSALLGFSQEKYQQVGENLLVKIAEYYQALPETRYHQFSNSGGFLEHALERTLNSLKIGRAYFLPTGGLHQALTEAQSLWMYVIFSASLLHDVGKLVIDLTVEFYNPQKAYLKKWSPFEGSMIQSTAVYYKYDFEAQTYSHEYKQWLTLLLARQIMPISGFDWIKSTPETLRVWLALLLDNKEEAGTLGPVLARAEALAINQYFSERQKEWSAKKESKLGAELSATFGHNQSLEEKKQAKAAQEMAAGLEFMNWLQERIANGNVQVNENGVYHVAEGVLVTSEMFEQFVQENPHHQSAKQVQESFAKVGGSQAGSAGLQNYLNAGNNARLQGVLLRSLDLAITQGINANTLRLSPVLQNLVQVPGGTSPQNQPAQQMVAPNGQWINAQVEATAPRIAIDPSNPFK